MPRRKMEEKNIRKLTRMGREGLSLGITFPKELMKELGWRERQKLVVKKVGDRLIIEDWKE